MDDPRGGGVGRVRAEQAGAREDQGDDGDLDGERVDVDAVELVQADPGRAGGGEARGEEGLEAEEGAVGVI